MHRQDCSHVRGTYTFPHTFQIDNGLLLRDWWKRYACLRDHCFKMSDIFFPRRIHSLTRVSPPPPPASSPLSSSNNRSLSSSLNSLALSFSLSLSNTTFLFISLLAAFLFLPFASCLFLSFSALFSSCSLSLDNLRSALMRFASSFLFTFRSFSSTSVCALANSASIFE